MQKFERNPCIHLCIFLVLAFSFLSCKNPENTTEVGKKIDFYTGLESEPIYSRSYIEGARSEHVFAPVLQGDMVRHDFILKNDSREALRLSDAEGCCGTLVESYTETIPPGQEGKISVLFLTDSQGGREIKGTIRAETNREESPEIVIGVSLYVKEFADLNPYRIWLKGSPADEIVGRSIVIPNEDYPFNITGIKTRKGVWFDHGYKEIRIDGRKAYAITVRNTRKKPGPYQDVLYVQTDHSARPEIKIRVEGRIGM